MVLRMVDVMRMIWKKARRQVEGEEGDEMKEGEGERPGGLPEVHHP
jgi:hypothetical protein